MAYEFTFTPRFQKHFKGLTAQEKKQLKNKQELLAQNPSHPLLRTKRIQGTADLFECSRYIFPCPPNKFPSQTHMPV